MYQTEIQKNEMPTEVFGEYLHFQHERHRILECEAVDKCVIIKCIIEILS